MIYHSHCSKFRKETKINYYYERTMLLNLDSLPTNFREWHQNFREECPEGILDKERILKIYQQISPLGNARDFVDQLFRIFDKDGNGSIDFKEFMLATDMTASGTPEEKLRWAFKVSSEKCLIFNFLVLMNHSFITSSRFNGKTLVLEFC